MHTKPTCDESELDSFTRILDETPEELSAEIQQIKKVFIHREREKKKISIYILTVSGLWIAQCISEEKENRFETYLLSGNPEFEPAGHEIPYFRECLDVKDIVIRIHKDYISGIVRRDHFSKVWQKLCHVSFNCD